MSAAPTVERKPGSVALWVFCGDGKLPDPQTFTGGYDGDSGEQAGGIVAPLEKQLDGSSYAASFAHAAVAAAKMLGVDEKVRAVFLVYDYAYPGKRGAMPGHADLTFVGNFAFTRAKA